MKGNDGKRNKKKKNYNKRPEQKIYVDKDRKNNENGRE